MTVYSVDRQAVQSALETWVVELQERPEVLAVIVFGSWVRGGFGVGSDVDVMLVLEASPLPFLERTASYRPDRFPVDLDVFPYTLRELQAGQPLGREALRSGRLLWQREPFELADLASGVERAAGARPRRAALRSRSFCSSTLPLSNAGRTFVNLD